MVRLCCLMSSDVGLHITDKLRPMREHGSIIIALRPRKPEGSLGRTAQDGHLDTHTAPELCHQDRIRAGFVQYDLGLLWKNGTESDAGSRILHMNTIRPDFGYTLAVTAITDRNQNGSESPATGMFTGKEPILIDRSFYILRFLKCNQ